jgi:hypothetical protein
MCALDTESLEPDSEGRITITKTRAPSDTTAALLVGAPCAVKVEHAYSIRKTSPTYSCATKHGLSPPKQTSQVDIVTQNTSR